MTPPLDDHPEAEPDRFGRRESLVKAGGLAIARARSGSRAGGRAPRRARAPTPWPASSRPR